MNRLVCTCSLILLTCSVYTCCANRNGTELILKETEVSRGMKSQMYQILPFLLAPALAMAGIMPWILPGIKMAVMFVTMINNMAFSSALFTLVRNYIFNTQQDEHIIYINHGYKKKKKPHRR